MVTAELVGGTLDIHIESADTPVTLRFDSGTDTYTVESPGLPSPFNAANTDVSAVRVTGSKADGQSFVLPSIGTGGGVGLTDSLDVDAGVESTTIARSIAAAVSIGSGSITLAADVDSADSGQSYGGTVTLAANVRLTGAEEFFAGGVVGNGFDLVLDFSGVTSIDGALFSGIGNLTSGGGGTTSLFGHITTSGAQTYGDSLQIVSDTVLDASSISFTVVAGFGNRLTLTSLQPVILDGDMIQEMRALTVNGPARLRGAFSAMETLGFTSPMMVSSLDADTTLSAAAITLGGDLDGNFHSLQCVGPSSVAGTIYRMTEFTVSGPSTVAGRVFVDQQAYHGIVTLAGDVHVGGNSAVFDEGIDGLGQNLLLSLTSPIAVNDGVFRGIGRFQTSATTVALLGSFTTSDWQLYDGPVELTGAVSLNATLVEFRGTVSGSDALSILTKGFVESYYGVVLEGPVTVGSLDIASERPTLISGGAGVATGGVQRYVGAVDVDAMTVLTASEVAIGGVLSGGLGSLKGGLQITGNAILDTAAHSLSRLKVTGAASLAGDVSTQFDQVYQGPVTLAADVTLTGTSGSFASGVNGNDHALGLNYSEAMILDPTVFVSVGSFSIGGGGTTTLITDIATSEGQSFADEVIVSADVVLTAGSAGIAFFNTLRSTGASLRTVTVGDTLFGGDTALGAIEVSGGRTVFVSGLGPAGRIAIDTSGSQVYAGDVVSPILTILTAGAGFTFGGSVTGAGQLDLRSDQTTTFRGAVRLGSLHTDAGGTTVIDGGAITTTDRNTMEFGDAVVLSKDTQFDAGVGDLIFRSTVDGPFALTARSAATTRFDGTVGAGSPLRSLLTDALGDTVVGGGAITTMEGQVYGDAVTLGKDTVLSAATGPVTLAGTVTGSARLVVNTPGVTTFSKAVTLASLSTDADGATAIDGGAVTTTGTAGQIYGDVVTFGKDTVLSAAGGPVTMSRAIDSAVALRVTAAGATTFAETVKLASLVADGGGATAIDGGAVTTTGVAGQVYGDAVTLGKDTVLTAATGPVTLAGTVGGLVSLAVTTSGATIFGGAVNLASLSTDGLGTTAIDGGAVTTTAVAGQVYGDAVTLGKETVLSAATGPVTLVRALSGSTALAVKTDGVTTFGGVVTLGSLETDAGGLTVINGGTSATGGLTVSTVLPAGQVYRDAVRLGRATALSAGNGPVTFGGTVSAVSIPIALDVQSAGVTTFGDTVDVARLVTDAPGMTVLGGAQATGKALVTRGGVSFGDPVVLAAPIVISTSGGPVTFLSTVDGAFRLEVVTSANTTFRGAVGAGTPLAGLVTNAGGTSRIEGGLVRTSGALGQSYGDAVIVTRATSFKDEATGRLDFKDALSGRFAVEMAANRGSIEFAKGIGSGARLAGLSILAASAVNSAGAIMLSGTAPGASRDGLQIGSGVSRVSMTVTGSLIEGFAGSGIRFVGGSADSSLGGFAIRANGTGVRVGSGDYGGTFVHSNAITGNTGSGVVLDATAGGVRALTVGGIEAAGAATGALRGNSIARNGLHGIEATRGSLAGSAVVANSIVGNGGSPAGGSGIAIAGDGLIVGWDVDAGDNRLGNRISGNASHGIDITGIDNSILSNAIHSNGGRAGQGVRLGAYANGAAVTPQIVNVARDNSAGVVRIEVRVPGAPHTSPGTHLVQVFCNGAADEFNLFPVDTLAFEGRSHVGPVRSGQPLSRSRPTFVDGTPGVVAVTGEDGLVTVEVPASVVPVGSWLTATATRLAGGSPQGTSGFSRAFQVQNAPTLAIGGDGPGTTWDRELVYTVGPNGTLLADNLSAGVVSALTARRNGALLLADIAILLTEQGLPTITRRQVADIVARGEGVEITLAAPPEGENAGVLVPGTTGTAMLADVSLPAARLYDASRLRGDANVGAVARQSLLLDVGADRILRALADATSRGETAVTAAERNAFVTRFQGGLRVASADFDGDGTAELVTAPGAVPGQLVDPFSAAGGQTKRPLSEAFGAASRVITIYNGRTDAGAKWSSVSIDMGSFFNEPAVPATKTQGAIPAKNYAGGFLVATGDLLGEGVNSGNGLAELLVVSTGHQRNRAFVFDVAVAAKGERPQISLAAAGVDGTRAPIPSRVIPLEAGQTVTGVAVAAFGAERDQERTIGRVFADIAIASTSAVSDQLSRTGGATALDTSTLRVYRGGNGGFVGGPAINVVCPIEAGAPRTAVVNGVAVKTKVIQNAFLFGAGLASGDIDHDLRPDLVLGAQAGGLGTFRVIDNSVVRTLLQPTTTRADGEALLTRHLTATQPGADRYGVAGAHPGRPDDNRGQWQPQGGTDFFLGKRVPTPIGAGFNAPLSVAVVERNGRSFSADVFAALGASNQAMEQVRWYEWQAAGEWRAGDALLDTDGVATTNRFRPGRGLRLG